LCAREGVLPFRADAMMRLYDEIRDAPLRFPRGAAVSPALAELLFALLAKDPAQRPSMPQIMAHPWVTHGGAAPMRCLQVCLPTLHPVKPSSFCAVYTAAFPLMQLRVCADLHVDLRWSKL
jgi:serine/threonine protein kinase